MDSRNSKTQILLNGTNDQSSIDIHLDDPTVSVPWDNEQDKDRFGVAINGQCLSFLVENIDQYEAVLFKVLLKAQVYARMSPDGKA